MSGERSCYESRETVPVRKVAESPVIGASIKQIFKLADGQHCTGVWAELLQNAHKLSDVVFDKNGTITYRALSVASVCVLEDCSTGMVMSLATFLAEVSTADNYSEHLLATAVVRFSKMMLGQGVVGNKEKTL